MTIAFQCVARPADSRAMRSDCLFRGERMVNKATESERPVAVDPLPSRRKTARASSKGTVPVSSEGPLPKFPLSKKRASSHRRSYPTRSHKSRSCNDKESLCSQVTLPHTNRSAHTQRRTDNPNGDHSRKFQQTHPRSPGVEQQLQRETQLEPWETLCVKRDCRVPVQAEGSQTRRCPPPQHLGAETMAAMAEMTPTCAKKVLVVFRFWKNHARPRLRFEASECLRPEQVLPAMSLSTEKAPWTQPTQNLQLTENGKYSFGAPDVADAPDVAERQPPSFHDVGLLHATQERPHQQPRPAKSK